jgi:capsular exopolysaccharide synthesis family protein
MTDKQKKQQASERAQRISKVKHDIKYILSQKSGFYQQEAYRALRTNVNFALANTEGCKVVMVTSALQGEGKSLTALNLAISLGQADKKVLLIDCDMRRPRLARLLNLSAPSGLSNTLMDLGLLEMAIINNEEHGIDLILAGDIPPNPAELLSSGRMKKLLERAKEQYDYVIIDSPPVDLVADAVALSAFCDGVLFVVRANHSERGAVIYGMEQLQYAKANILGFVLNGSVNGAGKRYQYGNAYRYDYGYYQYGQNAQTGK